MAAFGVPATVTGPAPGDTPVQTSGFFVSPLETNPPVGNDLFRLEPRRVFVVPRSPVTSADRGTTVIAADFPGGPTRTWVVDGLASDADPEHLRLTVRLKHT